MDNLLLPISAFFKDVVKETQQEKKFVIKRADGKPFYFRPGQFIILSIMGTGEAAFSITSDSSINDRFEICIMGVGKVSKTLLRMKAGDEIGIRGPYGTFFDTEMYRGCRVVFIAGGIGLVPLRPVVLECIAKRNNYKEITVLYGSKSIKDMVYKDNVNEWEHDSRLSVDVILDNSSDTNYKQGLITTLIDEREFDDNTHFIICGPPIMYRFVLKSLKAKSIDENKIWLSLERHMKCGIGKCGHCRIDDICVCESGPVFNYTDIKNKRGAL